MSAKPATNLPNGLNEAAVKFYAALGPLELLEALGAKVLESWDWRDKGGLNGQAGEDYQKGTSYKFFTKGWPKGSRARLVKLVNSPKMAFIPYKGSRRKWELQAYWVLSVVND